MKKKKIIAFQHIEVENLDFLEKLLINYGFEIEYIKLFNNQKIPNSLEEFSLMVSLGGPMDTWMESKYNWLKREKEAIKKYVVGLEKPFLGFCLGCQLLGEVLGGEIVKSKEPEIGFSKVLLNENVKSDMLFSDFRRNLDVFQLHSFEVKGLKHPDIKILGSSENTDYQLFKYKTNAYGIQFHIEISEYTIRKWFKVKQYEKVLKEKYGVHALSIIKSEQNNIIGKMNEMCYFFVKRLTEIID